MSNSSASLDVRIIGGTVTSVAVLFGFLGNVLLIAVSIKNYSQFRKSAFFLITWQMAIGDLLVIMAQLLAAAPDIFAGYDVYGGSFLPNVLGRLDSIGYMCNMFFALVLIMNRFCIFCLPTINGFLFGRRSALITISVVWSYVLGRTLYLSFSGCFKFFDTRGFFFRYSCANASRAAMQLNKWSKYESYALPGVMFILYIVVLCKIHYELRFRIPGSGQKNAQSVRKEKVELRLLVQSILICGMLQVETLAFVILPKIVVRPPGHYYINFLTGLIVIANSTTHPLVLFVFNTDVRQGLRTILHKATPVQNVSNTGRIRSTQTIVHDR